MKTQKAEIEIKNLLDSGLSFEYDFDYNNVNKVNLAINREGYSIKDIISKLKQGEKIEGQVLMDQQIWRIFNFLLHITVANMRSKSFH